MLAGVVAWALRPEPEPKPRARRYLAFAACLLTDSRGVGGEPATTVWAGMQDASLADRAKVQYVPVMGEATIGNATTYVAGLVQRRCDMILSAGAAQEAAVRSVAGRYPTMRFVVIIGDGSGPVVGPSSASGSTSAGDSGNITSLASAPRAELRRRVSELVHTAVKASKRR